MGSWERWSLPTYLPGRLHCCFPKRRISAIMHDAQSAQKWCSSLLNDSKGTLESSNASGSSSWIFIIPVSVCCLQKLHERYLWMRLSWSCVGLRANRPLIKESSVCECSLQRFLVLSYMRVQSFYKLTFLEKRTCQILSRKIIKQNQ